MAADRLSQGGIIEGAAALLAELGAPRDLITHWTGSKRLGIGVALFCGPLPEIGFLPAGPNIAIELEDPVQGRKLTHGYNVQSRPIAA